MCEDRGALEVEAPEEEDGLPEEEEGPPEEDIVLESPPTVLTIVTPAALTVVTTEPAERVLRTVTPAASVVVRRAPAVREAGADNGPAEVLLGDPEVDDWSGLEVTLDGEPGADEPLSVVAVLGLVFDPELDEVGP